MPMPKCLVFGSEGFVGPYLARELATHGWEIIGSDCLKTSARSGLTDYRLCDISSTEEVFSLVQAVLPDAVINLAAVSSVAASWTNPLLSLEVNVNGSVRILEAMRKYCPGSAVLIVGSGEGYTPSMEPHVETDSLDASSPYGISKATQDQIAELYSERYGMRIFRARPFNHTGIGQSSRFVLPSWCKQAAEIGMGLREPVIRVGNLEVERDFSDVRDVVRAYRLILESGSPGCVYNIGSGKCRSLKEILAQIVCLTGREVGVEVDTELYRPSDNPMSACNASKINNELGWMPMLDLGTTIAEMYGSFTEGLKNKAK